MSSLSPLYLSSLPSLPSLSSLPSLPSISSFPSLPSLSSLSSHSSLSSSLSLLAGGSSLSWTIRVMGLAASTVAVGAWFRSRSRVTKEVWSPSGVNAMTGGVTLESPSRGALAPSSLPPAPAAKKKKSVAFALERNTTRPVDRWIIDTWGHMEKPKEYGVRFSREQHWILVAKWLQPDGHNQLHFPRTKWIRNVPDWDVEDFDGDIDMLDI